jgi:serine/threonine protein kinase
MPRENQDRDVIVSKAIGIASEEERAAYIAQACDRNAELKHQVEERVAAHFHNGRHEEPDRKEGRNGNPSQNDTGTASPEQSSEQTEANHAEDRERRITRIGPYKVVKQIGESTLSIVFQVEQQEPARLTAALKVIKHGLDWSRIVGRFEAAREALSRMEHPNIAKLIGAGRRQFGQPYFVMELLEGLPLTKYCEERQQSLQ